MMLAIFGARGVRLLTLQRSVLGLLKSNDSLRPLFDKSIFWGIFANFTPIWLIVVSIWSKWQRPEEVLHRVLIPRVILPISNTNVNIEAI